MSEEEGLVAWGLGLVCMCLCIGLSRKAWLIMRSSVICVGVLSLAELKQVLCEYL